MLGRVLVFLGGLLVVVLFVALLAPLFIDWTDFRKNFEDQASRIIGKKVTVHGTVDARLLPFPSVTLHDVRVGQETDGTPLVQIDEFSMDAELAPFLSGEALIFDMRVSKPKVRLRLLKDGTLDWMRGSQPEIPAKSVVLESVHVEDGDLLFIDEQSGRTRHVTGLNAEMSAKSLAGPWRIEGDAALDGEHGNFTVSSSQPDDNGVLRVRTRLMPDRHPLNVDLDGELKLVDSKPDYMGSFNAGVDDKRSGNSGEQQVQPRIKGRFELTNDRIRVPEYRLEVGATDDPYVVTGEATLDTGTKPEFLLTADGQQIDVNRLGNNKGTNGKTNRNPAVSARQRLNSLIAIAAEIPVPQVPGKATFRLPAIVAGDTTVRDVQLDLEPAGTGWKIDHAIGTLPGRTQVEARGNLMLQGEPNFIGNLVVASNQPSGLASWLVGSVDPSIRQLRQAGFSADVSLRHEEQRFENLEIAVGPATLKGRIDRQVPNEKDAPKLAVDLTGDTLDLDALRALTGLFTGQDNGVSLFDHRITAHLQAGKFVAFGVPADNVDTSFSIAGGALTIDKLAVRNVVGAEITATGRADGSPSDYKGSGEITFKAADPGPFFEMLRQHLPHHPVMDRLVRNAAWYGNTALRGAVTLGGDQDNALTVTLAGVSNGSRVNFDYRMSDLSAFTGKGTTTLEGTLENSITSILFGQAGLDPLPVEADANGRMTLKVSASGTDPADAALTFATDKTSFTANGKVDVRPDSFLNGTIALSLESADLDPYFVMNGIGTPQMGTGLPVKFQANAVLSADKIVLSDMKGLLADNNVSGALTFDRKAANIKAIGALALDKVDLGWLAESIYGPMTDAKTGNLSREKLGLPAFTGLDIGVKLSAKQLWPGVFGPISNFTGNAAYKGEELRLNDLTGGWNGGTVSGSLMLANSDGTGLLQTKLNLADGDLAAVAWQRDGAPLASGRFGLGMNVEASGKSLAELAANASGSGEIKLGETHVRGLNLSVLPPLLSATDQIQGDITADKVLPIVQTLLNNGEAVLPATSIPFNISAGVVRAANIAAGNDLAKLSGNAEISLPDERMRGSLGIDFNAGSETQSGAEPAVRLDFAGPLASPGRTINITDVTSFLSVRAFERERRRVERLQANVLEKQRLRREVGLYKYAAGVREAQRQRDAAIEQQRRAEEIRLRDLARQAAAQKQAEDEAKAKQAADEAKAKAAAEEAKAKAAAEAKARAEAQQAPAPSGQAPKAGAPLNFNELPGVAQ
ncbi:AsmA family protein [Rhizobium rhizogenes]|uniref:AsmA family protein n=1 Tax=Rhizobium rhizogenes TaxID=359 RepID=UPI00157402C7|nr:AsmA family protein [Rhizobium rhizogenes]NTF42415.1 AsmA family protein [Rhizobium rhizogenes]